MEIRKLILGNIRKYRDVKGYSQEYMAEILEITQSAYAKIETGTIEITVTRLSQIAKILEIDILLLLVSDKNKFLNLPLNNISEKISSLTEENKELMKDLIETKSKLINIIEERNREEIKR